jgi:hypothetical protein
MADAAHKTGGFFGNLIAAIFIGGIVAAALWWFGPNFITELDNTGWHIAAAILFALLLVLFLVLDRIFAINIAFDILRAPYLLVMQPFRLLQWIDARYEVDRRRIADLALAGGLFGAFVWGLLGAVLFSQLVPLPQPCAGTRPCILVVGLQGDDFAASRTGYVRWALENAYRRSGQNADIVFVPRPLFRVVGGDAGAMRWEAKYWLDKLKGDAVLYGSAPQADAWLHLYLYVERPGGNENAGLDLPKGLGSPSATALALVAANLAAPAGDARYAANVLWPLVTRLAPQIAALPEDLPRVTRATILLAYADAAIAAGNAGNDRALPLAVAAYRRMLDGGIGTRIEVQTKLATALQMLGERENGRAKFALAAEIYRQAVAESQNGEAKLIESVAVYRAVLMSSNSAYAPRRWAATQSALGRALQEIGAREIIFNRREQSTTALTEAVAAYREALKIVTPPQEWAQTQYQLGCTQESLAANTGETTHYAEAADSFRRAMYVFTAQRAPLAWADAEYHMGAVLLRLGESGNDAAKLQAASEALRGALKVYSGERAQGAIALLTEAEVAIARNSPTMPAAAAPSPK